MCNKETTSRPMGADANKMGGEPAAVHRDVGARRLSALDQASIDEFDAALRNLQQMLERMKYRGHTDYEAMHHANTHLIEAHMWARRGIGTI